MRGFRNLADATLDVPDAGCVIVGPNGHGKTSLIEAMLYPQVFRSFRGAADHELVRFGADGFHLDVLHARRGTVGYDARTKRKKITVDGAEPERTADALGLVRGVVLSPTDVVLVAGGPRERRHYLDVLLALTAPGYLEALTRYRKALAHRARAQGAEMPAWEELLAQSGARLIAARCTWATQWAGTYASYCEALGEPGEARLTYQPKTDGDADTLRAAFAASRERDRALGRAGVGPHRDEIRLALSGRPLRRYGSAGQQRTAALALRLLEADAMEERGAVLLALDDAFAELDADRSRRLGELIEARAARSQIVAAVPRATDVPDAIASLARWRVECGKVA